MPMAHENRNKALALWLALSVFAPAGGGELRAEGFPLAREFAFPSTLQLGAPQSGVLTVEPDRLFAESAFGRRVSAEIEAEGAVLTAENRRIEAELREEEQELTRRRPEMEAEAFRALADAFDSKVQETRRLQEQKLREISKIRDKAHLEFLSASTPILEQIMREAGAGAILDRSAVFLSSDAVDITDLAIVRVDQILGDGSQSDEIGVEDQ